MKLIAETQQENAILDGISVLLSDLGIETDSYRQEEAIAVTFLSANDVLLPEALSYMSREEQEAFLCSMEDALRASMLAAGYRTLNRALRLAAGVSHPDRHLF